MAQLHSQMATLSFPMLPQGRTRPSQAQGLKEGGVGNAMWDLVPVPPLLPLAGGRGRLLVTPVFRRAVLIC